MTQEATKQNHATRIFFLLPVLISYTALHCSTLYLNLTDEGFAWYGIQRAGLGEIPVFDFHSYDPGRSYLGALWCDIFGDYGLMNLKIFFMFLMTAILIFAWCIEKFFLRLSSGSAFGYFAAFGIWAFLPYKNFEGLVAILQALFLARVAIQPSIVRYISYGTFCGISWLMGRNMAAYGVAAGAGLIFVQLAGALYEFYLKPNPKSGESMCTAAVQLFRYTLALLIGFLLGSLPMLLHFFLIPEFTATYVARAFESLATQGASPLAQAFPWPTLSLFQLRSIEDLVSLSICGCMLLFPAIAMSNLALSFRTKVRRTSAILSATGLLGLTWYHYLLTRADIEHIAIAAPIYIVGIFAAITQLIESGKRSTARMLGSILLFLGVVGPFLRTDAIGDFISEGSTFRSVRYNSVTYRLWPAHACVLQTTISVLQNFSVDRELVAILPFFSGAYATLGLKSPIYDIYATASSSLKEQHQMIAEISNSRPEFILLWPWALDNRPELKFQNAFREVWSFISSKYKKISWPHSCDGNFVLFRRPEEIEPPEM